MIKLRTRPVRGRLLRAVPLALAAACFPAVAMADDVAPTPPGTVVARDDFSTTTRQNGEFHTRTFSDPVNFQTDGGTWSAINRTLTSDGGDAVGPKNVDGDAAIPSSLDDPIRLQHDSRNLSFQLLGADGSRDTAGSTAQFDDAIPNADIKYRALSDGLKESVVLQSAATRRVFNYAVTGGDDLTASIAPDGDFVLADPSGDEKFRISAPLAWDSAADPSYSNKLDLSFTRQSAGNWTLTMRPDAAWLDDPARVYPVTLDPDVYWLTDGSGAERFHGANQDCHMQGSDLAGNSYCSSLTLSIGYYRRSYRANLRFDLAAAIPAYATVTNAQLAMFLPGNTTHAAVNSRVKTITSDWDNNASWNKRKTNTPWTTPGGDVSPAANLTGTVNPSVGNGNYWYYWNTPLDAVNGWIKGTLPNYGLQVSTDIEDGPTGAYSFVSTDGNQANWPALDLTWVPDTTPPPAPDDLQLDNYDPSATTPTAQFDWNPLSDPANSDGTPGSGIVAIQERYALNGGAASAWTTVPAATLSIPNVHNGNTIVLDVRSVDAAGNTSAVSSISRTLTGQVTNGITPQSSDGVPDDDGVVPEAASDTTGAVGDAGIPDTDDGEDNSVDAVSPPATARTNGAQALSSGSSVASYTVTVHKIASDGSHVRDAKGWATMRNKARQLVIGSIRDGGIFDKVDDNSVGGQAPTRTWGFAHGSFDYCGWLFTATLAHHRDPGDYTCGSLDHIAIKSFAALINCDSCDGGTKVRLDQDAYGYRNVQPWNRTYHTPRFRAIHYHSGDLVAWRYVTPDNQWVEVIDSRIYGHDNVAFVPRSAFGHDSEAVNGMCANMGNGAHPQPTQKASHSDWPPVCGLSNPTPGN